MRPISCAKKRNHGCNGSSRIKVFRIRGRSTGQYLWSPYPSDPLCPWLILRLNRGRNGDNGIRCGRVEIISPDDLESALRFSHLVLAVGCEVFLESRANVRLGVLQIGLTVWIVSQLSFVIPRGRIRRGRFVKLLQ